MKRLGIGGICGLNSGVVSDCVNRGNICDATFTIDCGGICSMMGDYTNGFGKIENCMNKGNITGKSSEGISSEVVHGNIVNVWNSGTINGQTAGPIFGFIENQSKDISIKNTFYLKDCCENYDKNLNNNIEMKECSDSELGDLVESLGSHFKVKNGEISMFWE